MISLLHDALELMCHAMRATLHKERDVAISLVFGVTLAVVTTLSQVAIF